MINTFEAKTVEIRFDVKLLTMGATSDMLNKVSKLLLTGTALAPVFLVYAIVAFLKSDKSVAACLFLIFAAFSGIGLWLLYYVKKHLERMDLQVISVEIVDSENIAFLLLYLLPLLTGGYIAPDWQIWVPTILILGAVIMKSYSYHFNPLLSFMGWHFYKIGTQERVTYILITKKQLRNVIDRVEVGRLTEYILIDLGEC